ncbi:hypothetical protein IPC239_31030 [Pseudomonas aeruginosa]|nr:hypothetical protein IPC239_31030 [Pseudomonas aeruginosa]
MLDQNRDRPALKLFTASELDRPTELLFRHVEAGENGHLIIFCFSHHEDLLPMVDENRSVMQGIEDAAIAPLLVGDLLQELANLDFWILINTFLI